jgi:exonuclease SbcC
VRELNRLVERIAALESKFNEARQEIELKAQSLTTTIENDAEDVRAGEDIREEMDDTADRIAALEKMESEREIYQNTINDLNEESAGLKATNRSLKLEMDEIKSHLDLIENSTEARCPVCKQPLDDQHRAELITQMSADGTERGDTFRANNARMDEVKGEIEHNQARIQEANQHIKDLPRLRAQFGGYEQRISAAQEANTRIEANEIHLAELQSVLDEGRFAEAIQLQLDEARAERDALGYDEDAHDAVKETLQTHVDYQNRAKELEFAQNEAPKVMESLASAQKQRERWLNMLSEYDKELAEHGGDIEGLEVKVAEMNARQEELDHQRTQRRLADNKVVGIEQELKAITSLRERRAEAIEYRARLNEDESTYEQLKNAFGRNGIPAMMIEAAIPELEDAANRLLSRMTSNRMHIRFDTQREKKTGGIAETLDIWIQDELGQRDYSLYSGGEAFRVNFAIRVALSQLLARRAGARLRALFIDEGFGTQDEAGRERLIEAITSIQDDFDLVLVITHIDELKDAFPARIEVTKTPNGSLAVIR